MRNRDASESGPYTVWWDNPEDLDPANPMSWSSTKKWVNIMAVSVVSFLVPLVSAMIAPVVQEIMTDLGTDSALFATFSVSIFVLGFASGPLLLAPLSELYGRVIIYNITNACFVVFTVLCGWPRTARSFLAFRFLSGFVGVTTIAVGSGTIADLMPRDKRGKAVSVWAVGTILGPMFGPTIGGYVAEVAGWRWMFYIMAIVFGIVSLVVALIIRETYSPVLLERKAARLRKETGNPDYRSRLATSETPRTFLLTSIVRPCTMLLYCPIVTILCTYVAILYGTLYLLFATYSFVFKEIYGFSTFEAGLVFIAGALGTLVGLFYLSQMSDKAVRKGTAAGTPTTPEDRVPLVITIPGALTFPAGLFVYGWSIEAKVHWIVPQIGTAITGFGSILVFISVQTYFIDVFEEYAASAVGANVALRGIAGALLPLSGLRLYYTLGWGWGTSVLGFLSLALAPVPILLGIYGQRIRKSKGFGVKL